MNKELQERSAKIQAVKAACAARKATGEEEFRRIVEVEQIINDGGSVSIAFFTLPAVDLLERFSLHGWVAILNGAKYFLAVEHGRAGSKPSTRVTDSAIEWAEKQGYRPIFISSFPDIIMSRDNLSKKENAYNVD